MVQQRIEAIDQYRGLAIICMVILNFGATIKSVPDWLKHVPDIGFNLPDLGAPLFIFTIGLTYGLSFRQREARYGLFETLGHFVRRYLAIVGMGAIFAAGQRFLGLSESDVDWGVLQAIGGAGLITLIVIRFSLGVRLATGLALLAAYQLLLNKYWLDLVLNSPHGGFPGTLSWAGILIISTVFGDLYQDITRRRYFPLLAAVFVAASIGLALVVPISKNRVSASYDLITIGISGLIFFVFYRANFSFKYLSAWGRNPILLYTLSLIFTGLFVLPRVPVWHTDAPLWLAGAQALFLLLVMGSLALYWQKKAFSFSI